MFKLPKMNANNVRSCQKYGSTNPEISLKKNFDESIVVLVADRFTKFMQIEKCGRTFMEFPSTKWYKSFPLNRLVSNS